MGRKKGKKSGEQKGPQAAGVEPEGAAGEPSQQPPPQQPPPQQVPGASGAGDTGAQSKKKKKQKQEQVAFTEPEPPPPKQPKEKKERVEQKPQFTEPEPPPPKQQPRKKKEQTPPLVVERGIEPQPQQPFREQRPPSEETEQFPTLQQQPRRRQQPAGRGGFGRGQPVVTEVTPGLPPSFPALGQRQTTPEAVALPQAVALPARDIAVRGPSPPQQVGPPPGVRPPSSQAATLPARDIAVRGPSPPQVRPPPGIRPPSSQAATLTARDVAGKGPRGPSPTQQTRPPPGMKQPQGRPAPSGPSQGDIETVTRGIKGLGSLTLPLRKDRTKAGTKGRRIIVETNHLRLDLTRLKRNIVIHYDVNIDPNVPKRLLRPAMEVFRCRHFGDRFPAFDGRKNLYSSGELPFGGEISDVVEVHDEENNKMKPFKITIKFAAQVDLRTLVTYMTSPVSTLDRPQQALQAIDVVLRSAPAFRFVQVGRSFFTPPRDQIISLGDGLELWHGFYQSAILGWKPYVNVDVAHKGFPSSKTVLDAICEVCRLRYEDFRDPLNFRYIDVFQKYIRGLKIEYEIPGVPGSKRTYKVNKLVDPAARLRFTLDNNETITVKDYFSKEKRYNLKYPNLPCLHVGSLNRPKPIYLPAELCAVVRGQVTNRKMNEIQTSNMIKEAATSTDVRKRKILDALRQVRFNDDPCVREFGLSVSDRFEKVEARILDPPMLEYNEKVRPVRPVRGVWRADRFLAGKTLDKWTVLNLNRFTREDDIRGFGQNMVQMGKSLGMNVNPPTPHTDMHDTRRLQDSLADYFRRVKNSVQLVVVVVPDKGDHYGKVKQMAELQVGVLTQCIRGRTMSRMNPATCSNILLKVNSKLNGVNHSLSAQSRPACLRRPVMIVGADVTHPSPDQTDIPSVAAVTASHDPKAYQYNIQIRLQPPRVEIIEDLENIIKQHLLFFYRQTKLKPEKILFFRDGVSEGQFKEVMNSELMAIRRACSSVGREEYKPNVTFLVVQKRHHTRFFPSDADADGKNRNVPAGTVVDTEITHPTEIDFYLASHASIQGVSRPTKYHVLWDDSEMSEDELEELTYYLCHMFARCTRSVSYPTPTYYAHLAAFRARVYLEGQEITLTTNLQSQQERLLTVAQEIIQGHPMYFV